MTDLSRTVWFINIMMIILLYGEKAGVQEPTIDTQSSPDKASDIWKHKGEINFALCWAMQGSSEHLKQNSFA